MMLDDKAPTHERRKLIKTYKKKVLPRKWTVVTEVSGETYSKKKIDKNVVEKRPQT